MLTKTVTLIDLNEVEMIEIDQMLNAVDVQELLLWTKSSYSPRCPTNNERHCGQLTELLNTTVKKIVGIGKTWWY